MPLAALRELIFLFVLRSPSAPLLPVLKNYLLTFERVMEKGCCRFKIMRFTHLIHKAHINPGWKLMVRCDVMCITAMYKIQNTARIAVLAVWKEWAKCSPGFQQYTLFFFIHRWIICIKNTLKSRGKWRKDICRFQRVLHEHRCRRNRLIVVADADAQVTCSVNILWNLKTYPCSIHMRISWMEEK